MAKEVVFTAKAPAPVGPYSQAVRAGGFLFVAGQIPMDPASMAMPEEPALYTQSFRNSNAVALSRRTIAVSSLPSCNKRRPGVG